MRITSHHHTHWLLAFVFEEEGKRGGERGEREGGSEEKENVHLRESPKVDLRAESRATVSVV